MKIYEKIPRVEAEIRFIVAHRDVDSRVRLAALDEIEKMVAGFRAQINEETAAEIAAETVAPPPAEEAAPEA